MIHAYYLWFCAALRRVDTSLIRLYAASFQSLFRVLYCLMGYIVLYKALPACGRIFDAILAFIRHLYEGLRSRVCGFRVLGVAA